jgi:Flp pilus assembly protein TadG
VLLLLLLGSIDVSNAILVTRRLEAVATAVADMASTGSAQEQALNIITDQQASEATTAAFAYFPNWARQTIQGGFSVTLSGITFNKSPSGCTSNCVYTPTVVWSVGNPLGVSQLRPCGTVAVVPDISASTLNSIPVDDVGATSLFVADVQYTFTPLFAGFLFGSIPLTQQAVVSPRIGNGTTLLRAGGLGIIERC